MYDIIIIGGGFAGLTAAIYARRAGKSVLVIENNSYGGQISYAPTVENYPGITSESGIDLSDAVLNQALALGAETLPETATKIDGERIKTVFTNGGEYTCKALIISTGLTHRKTGLENEERFIGKGVSYCAVCDGGFFKGKDVAVLGGGNTAVSDAVFLSDLCRKVTVIHRRGEFRADKIAVDALRAKDNITLMLNSSVTSLNGADRLESITVETGGEKMNLKVSGLFIAIGNTPRSDIFKDAVKTDEKGYIIAGEDCVTSSPGIFAAGDCRTKPLCQLVTAAADGAVAAVAACAYIDSLSFL